MFIIGDVPFNVSVSKCVAGFSYWKQAFEGLLFDIERSYGMCERSHHVTKARIHRGVAVKVFEVDDISCSNCVQQPSQ